MIFFYHKKFEIIQKIIDSLHKLENIILIGTFYFKLKYYIDKYRYINK